jgi:beta-galactosidase
LRDNPPLAGEFIWTGFDYLGEGYHWPNVSWEFGLFDRTGLARPAAHQVQSWWTDGPMVSLARGPAAAVTAATTNPDAVPEYRRRFADWTPRQKIGHWETVQAYSNCEQVELFLNGRTLGRQVRPADDSPRIWQVPFEPGTLRAVATSGGKVVAQDELRTAGKATRIVLSASRQALADDGDDVCYIRAAVVDEQGVVVPDADDLIAFQIRGPGVIVAVDSADIASHEPFAAAQRRAFGGRCVAIVKATAEKGPITVTAGAAALAGSAVTIQAVAPAQSR